MKTTPIIFAFLAGVLLLGAGCRKREAASPSAASHPPFQVSAALSTNVLHVGDVVTLDLRMVHPAGTKPVLPVLAREKEIVVRSQSAQSRQLDDTREETVAQIQLTSLKVGTHVLSTGLVQCVQADGGTMSEPFPLLSLQVETTLARADEPMRDIKGLQRWPGKVPRWAWVFLLIAVLASVAGVLLKRILSSPRTILHVPPPPPPHEVALSALRRLLEKGWIETGNIEPFYIELSSIARHYMEDRFQLHAPERTTEEFIREAVNSRLLSPEHQQLVRDFLEQCDLVKFARHQPGPADMRGGYSSAERLVKETTPAPAPVSAGGAA